MRALDRLIAGEKHVQQRHWQLTMVGLTDNNQPKAAEEEMVGRRQQWARIATTMGKDDDHRKDNDSEDDGVNTATMARMTGKDVDDNRRGRH